MTSEFANRATRAADKTTQASPDRRSHASASAGADKVAHASTHASESTSATGADIYTSATASRMNTLLPDEDRPETAHPGSSLAAWQLSQES